MEDVLSVYTRPYDSRFPQVCMDESAKQLLQDKRESLPMQKGLPSGSMTSLNLEACVRFSWPVNR